MLYEVGKLFEVGVTEYEEQVKFDFLSEGPVLLIFFKSPTEKEVSEINAGKASFRLYEKYNIIFLLSKFGSLEWMDAPYTVHLSDNIVLDIPSDGLGYALNIFLIDAATGIIKAIRLIGLSTKFSFALHKCMQKQTETQFDKYMYLDNLNCIYRDYSTKDMLKYSISEV